MRTEFLIRSEPRANQSKRIDQLGSALGRAPTFNEEYRSEEPLKGDVIRVKPGTKVTARCESDESPLRGWSELIIAVQVPPGGARISRITIDYRAGKKQHRLILHRWVNVACGTKTGTLPDCERAPK